MPLYFTLPYIHIVQHVIVHLTQMHRKRHLKKNLLVAVRKNRRTGQLKLVIQRYLGLHISVSALSPVPVECTMYSTYIHTQLKRLKSNPGPQQIATNSARVEGGYRSGSKFVYTDIYYYFCVIIKQNII